MFLCCGESLTDIVVTADGAVSRAVPGGGPANTARALASAGLPTALFAGISTDLFGAAQRRAWEAAAIDCAPVVTTDLPSTLAVAEPNGEGTTYRFYLEGTAALAPSAPAPVRDRTGEPWRAVHVGGLATAVEPLASVLRDAAQAWRSQGSFVSYDPNIRAGFEERGQDIDSVVAWVGCSDLVKASTEDIAVLRPGSAVNTVLDEWIAAGAGIVVVTDGAGEVRARTLHGRATFAPSALPEDVSSIGAGDAFTAGILLWLNENALLDRERVALLDDDALMALLHSASDHTSDTLRSSSAIHTLGDRP